MSYTPLPGTIPFRAIAHLNALAEGTKIANAVLADALDVDAGFLSSTLKTAVLHGAVKREKIGGRTYWMRGDGAPTLPAEDYEPDEPLPPRNRLTREPKPTSPFVGIASGATTADVEVTSEPSPDEYKHPASQPEQPLQGCKDEFAVFGYFSDGRISIERDGKQISLDQQDTYELVKFVRRVFG